MSVREANARLTQHEDGYGCEEEDGARAEEAKSQEGESREGRPGRYAEEGEASPQEEVNLSGRARVRPFG